MIHSALYRSPELLDPARHGALRMSPLTDYSVAAPMHGVFVAATEMVQVAVEFPLVFVKTGDRDEAGRLTVSPIALLGLSRGENLFVEGTRWQSHYLPAFIRRYPFLTATLPDAASPAVMIDRAWAGVSETEGEPLFDAQGQPTTVLQRAIGFLELFETEAQRTRQFCARLGELDLLKDLKADVTLPDGTQLTIEGFQVVDEEKLKALPDAQVLELHRSGMLMLLHLQIASMATMPRLVERKARRDLAQRGAGHAPQ